MTDTAQITFALFSHVAQQQEGSGKFYLGLCQSMSDGQHSDHTGCVVARTRRGKAVAAIDARKHRVQRRLNGKDGIEVCREHDHRSAAFRWEFGGGYDAQDIADFVDAYVRKTSICKTVCEPLCSRLLTKWRCWDGDELCLRIHERLGVIVQPSESGMDGPQSSKRSDTGESRTAKEERHCNGFRLAGELRSLMREVIRRAIRTGVSDFRWVPVLNRM